MSESKGKQAEKHAGAFLAPDMLAAVPMRTLSDEYHDEPVDPPDDHQPPPEAPTFLRRAIARLKRLSAPSGRGG
jgi:hypothetical protein